MLFRADLGVVGRRQISIRWKANSNKSVNTVIILVKTFQLYEYIDVCIQRFLPDFRGKMQSIPCKDLLKVQSIPAI